MFLQLKMARMGQTQILVNCELQEDCRLTPLRFTLLLWESVLGEPQSTAPFPASLLIGVPRGGQGSRKSWDEAAEQIFLVYVMG